ncbi:hypothetical protein BD324DRAFT_652422 [Kockovaella imperatae]|uniref:SAC3/GANP/Nin1/mts3/eIF-3 p25 family-domain-containing protein n=1 Tax=Kockovaella imperatae TaxID=4999 RepID=A0A1Y1UDX5_9TREE|nr:hypothetical protein BD324DRAFT_652422 [Kockovaella imperatae]ORX35285.1 hypothetical protein BD324DRAFT_652422 [Kockovaella imperatae]
MQRYQPPHQRQRGSGIPHRSSAQAQSGSLNDNTVSSIRPLTEGEPFAPGLSASRSRHSHQTQHASASYRSKRDWTAPALASPASDLKPMRSSTPGRSGGSEGMNEMEMMQSVSRSGGDGAEGDALKDWTTQERYRAYIDERIAKHHAVFSTQPHSIPSKDSADELQSLKSIVLLLRKLREGVVASHRIDEFALEVFETSARISILARDGPQLISSLSGLIPGLYTTLDETKGKRRADDQPSTLENRLAGLKIGQRTSAATNAGSSDIISDSRVQFASVLLLYHLAHSNSYRTYHSTLISLTHPTQHRLRRPFHDLEPEVDAIRSRTSGNSPTRPFVSMKHLHFAASAARVLSEDSFDPVRYFALLSDSETSPYERAVLSWAEERVRDKAWTVMRRAYLECRVDWVGRWVGKMEERDVHDWLVSQNMAVVNGRVSLR